MAASTSGAVEGIASFVAHVGEQVVMFGLGLKDEAPNHLGSWRVRQINACGEIGRDHGIPRA
jgi:hypothetical protein